MLLSWAETKTVFSWLYILLWTLQTQASTQHYLQRQVCHRVNGAGQGCIRTSQTKLWLPSTLKTSVFSQERSLAQGFTKRKRKYGIKDNSREASPVSMREVSVVRSWMTAGRPCSAFDQLHHFGQASWHQALCYKISGLVTLKITNRKDSDTYFLKKKND